jgi:hypothetical protein
MYGLKGTGAVRGVRALAVLLVLGTAACETASGPSATSELDTTAALADYAAFEQLFATDGWAGLQALGGRTTAAASSAVFALQAMPALGDAASSRGFALTLFQNLSSLGRDEGTFGRRIISDRHLGRTMVYDPARDEYVIAPNRTGAPSNGVRFITYEVDANKRPIPSREIGYADLIDEGANSGNVIVLRLLAVTRGATTLDYRTRVDIGAGANRIDVTGFAAEGSERLEFTIGLADRTSGGRTVLDATFDITLKPRGFRVTGTVTGVDESEEGDGEVVLTVRHQDTSLRVEMEETGEQVDGRILLNGATFVTITGTAANPVLRGATGQPVTGAELQVVRHVIELSDDVFDLVEDLVEPVEELILLGAIL